MVKFLNVQKQESVRRALTGLEFFHRYPSLHPFLYSELKIATELLTNGSSEHVGSNLAKAVHPSLCPMLILLSRLKPSTIASESEDLLDPFLLMPFIRRCSTQSTIFGEPPCPFDYPIRRLTMEEMLAKFINEGRREHEEMEIFIKEFRTTNELLLKTRSNLLTLFQIPKYVKYPKSLLTNKSRLEEACTETMNERCSVVLLNELPSKEKDPRNFTIPCQVLEKHKEAEDLATDHLSRFESPHMEVLTKREIADKFSDKHLMELKSKFKDDEPWYADFVNYIVGKEPYAFKLCTDNIMRRCVVGSETLEILAHSHSGPTGGHHSANVTAKKVYESEFYCPSVFKDVNNESRLMQLNELAELRDGSYENTRIYKERTKKWHDSRLRGDKDLSGPNIVKTVYPHGAIEITDRDGFSFKFNGQRLKKYYGGDIDKEDDEVIKLKNDAKIS
ncbi:hypothetical protein Tco_1082544 [Tanacetum coccineum]|uniref:tRNA (32-2'-O)-methyltransferase regulator THADA-like C-terminal TPR repeats region domain-containing protein n=1 Tax=Tanacetum coccineum TaxID=301880 RepID=A0ABQ5I0T1_9ASTR